MCVAPRLRGGALAAMMLAYAWSGAPALAAGESALPAGSNLDENAIDIPREVFHSETLRGHKSYLSNLGNLAFNSPRILGATAQKAHLSCGSCHVNGASNPKLFIPGLSSRPGNFDITNSLFNPRTDNGVLDPLTIPSLRGARFLSPYGHDGRTASLREFVRQVIVAEFAGPEPSSDLLDAIVIYVEDIDFPPNPTLDVLGHLKVDATPAERRGEGLFVRAFPHDPALSCAACHVPSEGFVDHRQHDIGSGGLYKTPTLVNADFNAPYFHDGRFDTYQEVIDYFDRMFDLGLTAQDGADLAAYLTAAGNGVRPYYRLTGVNALAECNDFASVLDIAIGLHDTAVVQLTARGVIDQLQDLAGHYPAPLRPGATEPEVARAAIAALIAILHRVDLDAATGNFGAAADEYQSYRKLALIAAPSALSMAERWSSFDPALHAAAAGERPTLEAKGALP